MNLTFENSVEPLTIKATLEFTTEDLMKAFNRENPDLALFYLLFFRPALDQADQAEKLDLFIKVAKLMEAPQATTLGAQVPATNGGSIGAAATFPGV